MGLLSFIKEAGEKLFGGSSAQAATAPADANATAAAAIKTYIEKQNLGLTNLAVTYDGASGKVTLAGAAPSQEASEKAALAAGNVANVTDVDNNLTAPAADPAQYHDVVKGDTLSAISKKYYGDANKYNAIFEANKPMLSHPDKIYPGQKLRIPPLK
ncbi:peptidoglycan-binding protein LysM [Variovorax sp. J22G21]|uniref:peptidoglycan-binding protein LysM n=1 Tax=Variovorax fucosicus TaxID=3053517 RepID=UPI00257806CB|nr:MULTISPECIES: peptidoglycan-binding protein LysM [unclassified Variovorax]MDM0038550.1 peptidoglycan-binding protein LysM [Variovorax sp. J22R193]MDM0063326.1 peptidoglycan-binding protein LysM [Variovorax sp. J22G21]